MRGTLVFRGAHFRVFAEDLQTLFQSLQSHRELPQFTLQIERDAVQLLEIVLYVGQG